MLSDSTADGVVAAAFGLRDLGVFTTGATASSSLRILVSSMAPVTGLFSIFRPIDLQLSAHMEGPTFRN